MKRALEGWFILVLLLGTMAYAIAEEITLTTYYPSPRGVYKELIVHGYTYLATDEGRVGIGTSTPSDFLEVENSQAAFTRMAIDNPDPEGGSTLRFYEDDSTKAGLSYSNEQDKLGLFTQLAEPITFRTDGGTERMRITGTGEVGIGTADPIAMLEVERSAEAATRIGIDNPDPFGMTVLHFYEDDAIKAVLMYGNNEGRFSIGTSQPELFTFLTDGTPRMNITGTGKVGVGMVDPVRELQVLGVIRADHPNTDVSSIVGGGDVMASRYYGTTGNLGTLVGVNALLVTADPLLSPGFCDGIPECPNLLEKQNEVRALLNDPNGDGNTDDSVLGVIGADKISANQIYADTIYADSIVANSISGSGPPSLWDWLIVLGAILIFAEDDPAGEATQVLASHHPDADGHARVFFDGVAHLKDGKAVIEVPADFQLTGSGEELNVILTPFGRGSLYVEERSVERVIVASTEHVEMDFGYLILATQTTSEGSPVIEEKSPGRVDGLGAVMAEAQEGGQPSEASWQYPAWETGLARSFGQAGGYLEWVGGPTRNRFIQLGWGPREGRGVDYE